MVRIISRSRSRVRQAESKMATVDGLCMLTEGGFEVKERAYSAKTMAMHDAKEGKVGNINKEAKVVY